MKVRGQRQKGDNKQNLRGSRAATPVAPKLSDLGISKTLIALAEARGAAA